MSIWDDRAELNAPAFDPNAPWLNKAIAPDASMELTFIEVIQKVRTSEDKIGKPGDTYLELTLVDDASNEKIMQQNGPRGAFVRAMREAVIEPNDKIRVTRRGIGVETSWEIVKLNSTPGVVLDKGPAKVDVGF